MTKSDAYEQEILTAFEKGKLKSVATKAELARLKACDARNCGRREFLHDDLDAITLGGELVARPPIELWPEIIRRGKVPTDIKELLLRKLEEKGASV